MKVMHFSRAGIWIGKQAVEGKSRYGFALNKAGLTVWWNDGRRAACYAWKYPLALFTYDTQRDPISHTFGRSC